MGVTKHILYNVHVRPQAMNTISGCICSIVAHQKMSRWSNSILVCCRSLEGRRHAVMHYQEFNDRHHLCLVYDISMTFLKRKKIIWTNISERGGHSILPPCPIQHSWKCWSKQYRPFGDQWGGYAQTLSVASSHSV